MAAVLTAAARTWSHPPAPVKHGPLWFSRTLESPIGRSTLNILLCQCDDDNYDDCCIDRLHRMDSLHGLELHMDLISASRVGLMQSCMKSGKFESLMAATGAELADLDEEQLGSHLHDVVSQNFVT